MTVNRTLSSAQAVIELLAEAGALAPAEIATRTGIARSSVYRLVEGLAAVGLAELLPDSRIRLSSRWLRLADAVAPAMREWSRAREVLDSLADRTGQTTYLTVPRDDRAICIAWSQGRSIDLLVLKPGRTLPLYVGAAGRNILAHSPALIDGVLAAAPLPALTPHTLTDAQALRADLEKTLADGYTVSDEDVTIGIGAIGAPIFADGEFMGCVSAAGLVQGIRTNQGQLVAELRRAARDIVAPDQSTATGYGADASA